MMNIIESYKIGSDIEWFVMNQQSKKILTAEPFIRGSKMEPFQFMSDNPDYAIQLDNVLAEGNIPPVTNVMDWVNNIRILRDYINSQLPSEHTTIAVASARLDSDQLITPISRTFGCSPALSAWTGSLLIPSKKSRKDNLRTAGFHVHCSFETEQDWQLVGEDLIRIMDLTLSVPAILIEPESERKINYGKPGEFRWGQSYKGVEYRSLSSWWADDDEKLKWVYNGTVKAINMLNMGLKLGDEDEVSLLVQEAINTNNRQIAETLVDKFQLELL